ncbi:hypothetical protein MRX96_000166 [Rhipicephalus microplus]
MNLNWIELYPDIQVDVPQPCGKTREGRLKADKAKELQEALDAEQQTVAKETRVYSYLNRPQITLESCPESETSSEIPLVNQPSPSEVSSQDLGTATSESDIPFVNETSFCEVPLQPGVSMLPGAAAPSVSELHKSITEELEKCSFLLYCCHDVQALVEARGLLQATFRKLAESVPQSSGLHIRGSPTKGCSSLKPLPKRRRL